MLYCAKNSANFLDALFEMANQIPNYLTNRADVTSVDWGRKHQFVQG